MNATTAFLCIMTLASSASPVQHSPRQMPRRHREGVGFLVVVGKKGRRYGKGTPRLTRGGMSSDGKSKQMPAPPDRTQVLEERLRSGQMEKPIAQGEVSDRLNQLYSGSNSPVQERVEVHDEPA